MRGAAASALLRSTITRFHVTSSRTTGTRSSHQRPPRVVARQHVDDLAVAAGGAPSAARRATVTANSDSPNLFFGSWPCLRRVAPPGPRAAEVVPGRGLVAAPRAVPDGVAEEDRSRRAGSPGASPRPSATGRARARARWRSSRRRRRRRGTAAACRCRSRCRPRSSPSPESSPTSASSARYVAPGRLERVPEVARAAADVEHQPRRPGRRTARAARPSPRRARCRSGPGRAARSGTPAAAAPTGARSARHGARGRGATGWARRATLPRPRDAR